MRRATLPAVLTIVFCAANARAQTSTDPAAIRREVEALNRQMEAAVTRGDLKAAAAFYADRAVVRTPRQVVAQGRAAIDRYFTGISNAKSWKLDVYGVTLGSNNTVYETGMSTLVHGSPEHTSKVEFVVVWERQRNGSLKIVLDYYHMPEVGR